MCISRCEEEGFRREGVGEPEGEGVGRPFGNRLNVRGA